MSEGNQNISKFIDYVKEQIELCIQKYMSLKETLTYLHKYHHICHHITTSIWEHLQRESPNFFKEYNKRCEVARQIAKFNDLLAQQIERVHKLRQIDHKTSAPATILQKPNDQHHHQDQIHYQSTESNDIAYILDSFSSLTDPPLFAGPGPVTKLQKLNNHHQDQIHDQWIGSNGEEAVSYFYDTPSFDATPQSDAFTPFAATPQSDAFTPFAATPHSDAFTPFAATPQSDVFTPFDATPHSDAFTPQSDAFTPFDATPQSDAFTPFATTPHSDAFTPQSDAFTPFATTPHSDAFTPFDATPQSDAFKYGLRYDIDFNDAEQFARDLDEQQQRLELKFQQDLQPQHPMDQQDFYVHEQHEFTTLQEELSIKNKNLQGDGPTTTMAQLQHMISASKQQNRLNQSGNFSV